MKESFSCSLCSTIILAPIVGGLTGTTLIPLLVATILAYCVTGYVRDEMYHPLVTKCVGGTCSILVCSKLNCNKL